jgi:hypothetical protein
MPAGSKFSTDLQLLAGGWAHQGKADVMAKCHVLDEAVIQATPEEIGTWTESGQTPALKGIV